MFLLRDSLRSISINPIRQIVNGTKVQYLSMFKCKKNLRTINTKIDKDNEIPINLIIFDLCDLNNAYNVA